MKNKLTIFLLCFILLFMTTILAEEGAVNVVTAIEETDEEVTIDKELIEEDALSENDGADESEQEIITDPEVLDKIEQFKLRFSGTKEIPVETQQHLSEALSTQSMPVDVLINGSFLKTDVDALIINDRTYLPLRAVVEAFNFTDVQWNADAYKAVVKSGESELQFLINTPKVIVNDETLEMDSCSLIIEGRTMVPIRYISEWLGFTVEWDSTYYTVSLVNESYDVNPDYLGGRIYSVDEMKTFAKLVMKEAGSVSYETKHGVASVVMNQVEATYLEDTITGVIFAKSRLNHFPPAHKAGFYDTIPNGECVLAVKRVLRGENSIGPCIFFNTSPFKGKTVFKEIDGVYFCY